MFASWKMSFMSLSLGAGLLLAGCSSTDSKMPASHAMAGDAMSCDKCKTTWVRVNDGSGKGGRSVGYTTQKTHVCPDCKDAVTNFFTTGTMKHECKACGGNMAICEAH